LSSNEQLCRGLLIEGLQLRGLDVKTVKDFGAAGRPDLDVVRKIDDGHKGPWVLVTMDFTVLEDFPGFDWGRYAISWVIVREDLRGAAFEHEKNDIVHRHVHQWSSRPVETTTATPSSSGTRAGRASFRSCDGGCRSPTGCCFGRRARAGLDFAAGAAGPACLSSA